MGIYIKGFKPKDGLYVIKDGVIRKYKGKGGTVRPYELVEVKEPHGRLIDADEAVVITEVNKMSEILKKDDVIRAIDDVMNNREIDSIRNAILAIRDKVIEMEYPYWEPIEGSYAVMPLRGNNELCPIGDWFDGAKYVVVDTNYKIDTGVYGAYWYSKDGIEE